MGIELSEGVGKGTNVRDVIVGLRTFPITEKPLVATGGPDEVNDVGGEVKEDPRDVGEGSVGSEENSDDEEDKEDGTMLLAGGLMVDENKSKLWASTLLRRVNREHSVEKEDARNMVGEGGQSRATARALDTIIYSTIVLVACSQLFIASRRDSPVQCERAHTFPCT